MIINISTIKMFRKNVEKWTQHFINNVDYLELFAYHNAGEKI